MHFIANFLIRSIIRTRLFNDYLGSLTNTPVIQRLLGCLTITAKQKAPIAVKRTKPRRRIALQRGSLMCGIAEKPYFKRFSGIEKVHRNSIKITVDLWSECGDLNPGPLGPEPSALPTALHPVSPSIIHFFGPNVKMHFAVRVHIFAVRVHCFPVWVCII